ncbi:peptidase A4 family protein [Colletotrichum somersetense]|nr:peptidase A4 family protein [Colletotrichum somersetense]
MKFASFVLVAAGIVAALPSTKLVRRNYSAVGPRKPPSTKLKHNSAPNNKITPSSNDITATGSGPEEYSSNWSGAILDGTGFKHVTGIITVPKVSGDAGSAASAWVGIDGSSCGQTLFQTGVSFYADGTFDAWYEWIPEPSTSYEDFSVSIGDQIKMTVDTRSKNKGVATLENLTTGGKTSHTFSSTPSTLCETNAEWIVEAFQQGGSQVTLVNFGTVTFTDAAASGNGGKVTPDGATSIEMLGSTVLTNVSINNAQVTVQYV